MLLERPADVSPPRRRPAQQGVACAAAAVTLLAHLIANPHYGFFRDELYFIICGLHPAWGYVDQPPLVPLLAALSQIGGHSLVALRAIPAVFSALAVYGSALFAMELGAGTLGVGLTALLVAASPVLMAFGARLAPDTIEVAIWPLIVLLCARIARGASPRWWLAIGALTGVGFYAKYSIVFFAVALLFGLLCTRERTIVRSGWFAAGVLVAVALAAPNVAWQWREHFPMIALLENDVGRPALSLLYPLQQIADTGPVFALFWMAGLAWFWRSVRYRFVTIGWIVLIGIMWLLHGKDYYPCGIYPALFAAGAVAAERRLARRLVPLTALGCALAASTLASLPFIEPVLPMHAYIAYQTFLSSRLHQRFNVYNASIRTPIQFYADMTGWPRLATQVRDLYRALPPSERARAYVFTQNFGEAAALQYYAGASLPPVRSGNNTYWLWGPGRAPDAVAIDVNAPQLLADYRHVRFAGWFENPFGMPYEDHVPIWIAREPRRPLRAIWGSLKNYSYLVNAARRR